MAKNKLLLMLAIFLVVAMSFSLISCRVDDDAGDSEVPQYGGILKIAYGGSIATFDIHQGSGSAVLDNAEHIAEYLFDMDINVAPQLGLVAEHNISEDGLIHTMKLRQGVLFHNGKEMTAEDVVASFNRRIKLAPTPPEISLVMESLIAPDKYTVEFHLKNPTPHIRHLMSTQSQFVIYPKELCEKYPDKRIPDEEIIGTGPYKIVEFLHDRYIRLVRFADYSAREEETSGFAGRKNNYVDEIIIHIVPDQGTRVLGVESGDYHYCQGIEYGDYGRLDDLPNVYPWIINPRGSVLALLNCALAPTNNVKLRQAIAAAVDADAIAKAMYTYEALYAEGMIASWLMGKEWSTEAGSEYYNQANPQKAKQLLQESGYDGTTLIIIGMTEFEFLKNAALIMAAQLRNVGFNVDVQLMDQSTWIARYLNPAEYHIGVFSSTATVTIPEQLAWTRDRHTGWWEGETPRKKELGALLRTAYDYDAKYKIWEELHYLRYKEAAAIKFCEATAVGAARIETKGWMPIIGHRYWNAWIK